MKAALWPLFPDSHPETRVLWGTQFMNRIVEIIIAGFLIAITLPLMAIISLAIKIDSPGPILARAYPLRGTGSNKTQLFKFRITPQEPRAAGRSSSRTRIGQFLY